MEIRFSRIYCTSHRSFVLFVFWVECTKGIARGYSATLASQLSGKYWVRNYPRPWWETIQSGVQELFELLVSLAVEGYLIPTNLISDGKDGVDYGKRGNLLWHRIAGLCCDVLRGNSIRQSQWILKSKVPSFTKLCTGLGEERSSLYQNHEEMRSPTLS